MSDAMSIIEKFESEYSCAVKIPTDDQPRSLWPNCTGTARMTVAPDRLPDEDFVYQCDTCGSLWYQNGQPANYDYWSTND